MAHCAGRHFVFRDEDGQSALEFAIVLPILLLLVCGIIEFGLLLNTQLTVSNCVREGARYAAIHSDETDVRETIEKRLEDFPLVGHPDITVTYSEAARRRGDVTVTVSAPYHAITPLGSLLFSGNTKMLSSTLTMKVE